MRRRHKEHRYYCYILANAPRNFYVGFTVDLRNRVWEHKTKAVPCVTNTWHECRLVYYESWQYVQRAIAREKQIKPWRREKKIWLIESVNRDWHDLSDGWYPELENVKRAAATLVASQSRPKSKAMPLGYGLTSFARGDNS